MDGGQVTSSCLDRPPKRPFLGNSPLLPGAVVRRGSALSSENHFFQKEKMAEHMTIMERPLGADSCLVES